MSQSSALACTLARPADFGPTQPNGSPSEQAAAYARPCTTLADGLEAQGCFHSLQISSANPLPISITCITEPFKALFFVYQTESG